MELLYAPMHLFINQPGRIGVVAFVFFVPAVLVYAVQRRVSWWLIVTALSWALFAWWEHYCTVNKFNIRVDLFMITPVLLSITIGGLWGLVEPWIQRRVRDEEPRMVTDETQMQ